MGSETGLYCCNACQHAAETGAPSACEGGACATQTAGVSVSTNRPESFGMAGRMGMMPSARTSVTGPIGLRSPGLMAGVESRFSAPVIGSRPALTPGQASRVKTPAEIPWPLYGNVARAIKDTGSTGCACNLNPTGDPVDPLSFKMPLGVRPTGRVVSMRGDAMRGTGAVFMVAPTAMSEAAWLRAQPGETQDEADMRGSLYYRTAQLSGETTAAWAARVQGLYTSLNATWKAWIDAMRRVGYLPAAPASTSASRPASGSAATGPSAAEVNAVIGGVSTAIAGAAGTVIGLVREANRADAEARTREAEAAAVRIARNDSRESMLIAAVREASGAGFDAQTALRMLRAGDRMGAITQLSTAQGRLAAAIGTAAAFPGSTALNSAISSAQSAVGAAAREIDSSAPINTPPTNPLNTNPPLPEQGAAQPWYKQPLVIAGAALAAALAFVAGRR